MTTLTRKTSAQIDALLEKTDAIYEFQCARLVERREPLRIVMLGLFAPLHSLLWGPGGVAKSMLFDGFARHVRGFNFVKTSAFKGSPPEQFLGPISLAAMTAEEERYVRIVKGKFPDADYYFCDELFRAPRAVLPAFLTGLSDNLFDQGGGLEPIPLRTFWAATNTVPETGDDDLSPFRDRFTFCVPVEPVMAQDSAIQIMEGFLERRRANANGTQIADQLVLARTEVDTLTERARELKVPREILEAVSQLRSNLLGAGIAPSIRRINSLLGAMQVDALLRGQDAVAEDQILLARHSLWTDPDEKEPVEKEVLKFASEWDRKAAELLDQHDGSADGSEFATRSEFLKLQADYAQTTASGVTREMTDTGLRIVRNHNILRPQIEAHIAAAAGRDTHKLEAVLEEMDLARAWIGSKLMGGLDVG